MELFTSCTTNTASATTATAADLLRAMEEMKRLAKSFKARQDSTNKKLERSQCPDCGRSPKVLDGGNTIVVCRCMWKELQKLPKSDSVLPSLPPSLMGLRIEVSDGPIAGRSWPVEWPEIDFTALAAAWKFNGGFMEDL